MSTLGSDFGAASVSNSNQFQHYNDSLFSPANVDQRQLALRQAQQLQQLQNQQKQMYVQQQKLPCKQNHLEQPNSSSSISPTSNCFSPDNLTNTFSQSTPEKNPLSQSPPSPADSGVVTDSKSEGGNVSQESLQNLEQHKLDDGLDFLTSKSPVTALSFGATLPGTTDPTQRNNLSFQADDTLNPANSLGLSSKNSFASDLVQSCTDELDNSVSMPPNLASIWSPSSTANQATATANNTAVEEAMLQALQQQQLSNWPGQQLSNNLTGLTNPPPGLGPNALIQKQLQQQQSTAAQIEAMQQQLALRRSQSTAITQANNLFNRSTSYQPGLMSGMGNMNGAKLNSSFNGSKTPSYSSWSNGQASLNNQWPSSNSRSATLFNSLQHSTSAFRKPSLSSQMVPPPRFNRSISTPAKYSSYMNGTGLPTSLDDNPFFKVNDSATPNGLMSLSENTDTMGFGSFESQLYDIMRSNENQVLANHNLSRGKWTDMNSDILFEENPLNSITPNLPGDLSAMLGEYSRDRFSRKVFVGGLPPDIDEEEIQASFRHFGPLVVDWPHKAESKSYFPPKGYAFLLFQEELSVQSLISCCLRDGDKLYLRVSSPTIREKPVQIRPWNLSDSDFVLDGSQPLDPRKTIFVGGVPRPLRAVELAMIMDRLYGGVCYAGIDVDPDLKYPKGAGRVAFSNQQSYIAAISARFVQLQHGDIDKRVEVKPYVLDDQHCDECQGSRCGGKFAPFFCANVTCLQYYCEHCWGVIHQRPGREFHKPLVKEGADRASRAMNYRW